MLGSSNSIKVSNMGTRDGSWERWEALTIADAPHATDAHAALAVLVGSQLRLRLRHAAKLHCQVAKPAKRAGEQRSRRASGGGGGGRRL